MVLRAVAAAALMALLTGCSGLGGDPPGAPSNPQIERLGDYIYMVPVARDPRGCVVYRVESPFRQSDRAPYWRVGKGNFTTDPMAVRCI
jgi:hypothetical protein